MYIAIDFDGTVVKHRYPDVGEDAPMAVEIIKKLIEFDHKIILYTMRSGKELEDAVNWYKERDIPLFGINDNINQYEWTDSRKVWAHIYIDDAALGCPLSFDKDSHRKYVNWKIVDQLLEYMGFYIKEDEIIEENN